MIPPLILYRLIGIYKQAPRQDILYIHCCKNTCLALWKHHVNLLLQSFRFITHGVVSYCCVKCKSYTLYKLLWFSLKHDNVTKLVTLPLRFWRQCKKNLLLFCLTLEVSSLYGCLYSMTRFGGLYRH